MDCHSQVESQALVHGSQGSGRPFGEGVVVLAGLRQGSSGGEHTGLESQPVVIGRHSGAGHRVPGTVVREPCLLIRASRGSAPCKLAFQVAAPQHL